MKKPNIYHGKCYIKHVQREPSVRIKIADYPRMLQAALLKRGTRTAQPPVDDEPVMDVRV